MNYMVIIWNISAWCKNSSSLSHSRRAVFAYKWFVLVLVGDVFRVMEPFLGTAEDKLFFREDLAPKIEIIRKLAREFADVYLPTDGLLNAAFIKDDPLSFAGDGVHPSIKGSKFIGALYAEYVSALIED